MRKARFIRPGGVYHVTSRVIEKKFIFDDAEKERMRVLLFQLASFSGVRILTHAIMSNHLHLLVEVPERPSKKVLDENELVRRLSFLPKSPTAAYSPAEMFSRKLARYRGQGNKTALRDLCEGVRERMFDLSRFLQEYKQRITQDYNQRHERKGTLWEDRFHSTLVEPNSHSLLQVAGYVDLNPLRAGLCRDPLDYRFCGYAAAVGGHDEALAGLKRLFVLVRLWRHLSEDQGLAAYRMLLFGVSAMKSWSKKENRACLSEENIKMVLAAGGSLDLHKKLSCKIRFFSEGIALGSKIFIQNLSSQYQKQNHLKRRPDPVPIQDLGLEETWTLNGLR